MWEFQAVVAGRCGPVLEGHSGPLLARRRLWVFHPQCRHGWSAAGDEEAEVLVFHFPGVPEPLGRLAGDGGMLHLDLASADVRHLRRLAGEAAIELAHPSALSPLCFQRILTELSILVCSGQDLPPPDSAERSAEEVCATALAWGEARLGDGVGVAEIAGAAHVSVAHLRRLFHQARGLSPQQALTELRMRRAEELVLDDMLGLEAVADACGYASASALSRAFAAFHGGRGPREWRRRQHPRHNPGRIGD